MSQFYKKLIFFSLLIVNIIVFAYSLFYNNVILTLLCFSFAMVLKIYNDNIEIPKIFQRDEGKRKKL